MVTLLSEIHFWTTQEDIIVKNTDYGSFRYYTKKEGTDNIYSQSKKQFCEQRGISWYLPNKRPQKLRDKLKELEECMIQSRIVCFVFEGNKIFFLLSTGLLVTLSTNHSGDLTNIALDKQLASKLQANIICDGIIFGNQVICICNDGHVLGYGGQWKDGWVLEGGPRRMLNYYGEWLVVWGKVGTEHPQPWSPLAKDHQRANLHLYWVGVSDPELLSYKKTDSEPLEVVVSKFTNRTLILIEQKVTQRGAVSVEVSNFELVGNNLKRMSVISVPLQTQVSCSALSKLEDRLLICCIDGSLALLDRNRGSTRTIKTRFIPTLLAWHPDNAVVAVGNDKGQLQYYDTALNCIKSQLLNEDCLPIPIVNLSTYFNLQFSIASINWGPKNLLITFEQGPIASLTYIAESLTFKSLIQNYLQLGKIDKAIKLLVSWEFKDDSFFALQKITAFLLRRPLNEEVAQNLQNALGCYHNSPIPIPAQIRHRFGGQVISLTRRFFHQLVRAEMFETAFLLAVDVGHHDLFMDLHYIAVKIGETEMAAAARAQASSLLSRCSSEASNCSRSSCSQCSEGEGSSNEDHSSVENQREDVPFKKTYVPPLPLCSDNCLTTDFNQPVPTTYKPINENQISLSTNDCLKYNYTPRATYVKSPQVPNTFSKNTSINMIPPPLPFTVPSSNANNVPYMQSTNFSESFSMNPIVSNAFSLNENVFSNPSVTSTKFTSNISSRSTVNNIKKSSVPAGKLVAPPLPKLYPNFISDDLISFTSSSTSNPPISNSIKKNQPKVKFSDTVTAFIVPEIKRPQRPPPPSHVTNPQKELADSLPLCHPNEDYLKDFAPVKKEDGEEERDNEQPKIKVIHFGVV
ncbi:WD repeat-containing and planar cell polarity effector protein fritz [Diorhabda carinulata]|uniref:WD repeat-containing and planar cell polarity effector protein fritz n=1 Tax=Diorhabda carinulata TaxID=1163345 RepID=UPI0025A268DD|nr:WD repeat-containing and planar cell polarity effector protein fritz [Diorhabda carinulata]